MRFLTLSIGLSLSVFAHAQGDIGTQSGASVGTRSESSIDRTKSINLSNAEKITEANMSAMLRSKAISVDKARQYRIGRDTPFATLFVKAVSEYENLPKRNQFKGNRTVSIMRSCSLYTKAPILASTLPWTTGGDVVTRSSDRSTKGWLRSNNAGSATHMMISGSDIASLPRRFNLRAGGVALTNFREVSHAVGYPVAHPKTPLRCYLSYAELGAEIIGMLEDTSIAGGAYNGLIVSYAREGRSMQSTIDAMLATLVERDHLKAKGESIKQDINRYLGSGCRMPTVGGLMMGSTDWSCGAMQVTPREGAVTLTGGMTILGANNFLGRSVSVSQVDVSNMSKQFLTKTEISRAKSKAVEKAKQTALNRTKGSRTTSGTDNSRGSNAGLGTR